MNIAVLHQSAVAEAEKLTAKQPQVVRWPHHRFVRGAEGVVAQPMGEIVVGRNFDPRWDGRKRKAREITAQTFIDICLDGDEAATWNDAEIVQAAEKYANVNGGDLHEITNCVVTIQAANHGAAVDVRQLGQFIVLAPRDTP